MAGHVESGERMIAENTEFFPRTISKRSNYGAFRENVDRLKRQKVDRVRMLFKHHIKTTKYIFPHSMDDCSTGNNGVSTRS